VFGLDEVHAVYIGLTFGGGGADEIDQCQVVT
jgi:hypothetical protein